MQKDSQTLEARRAFGLLFTAVAISVAVAAILTEIAFLYRTPLYYYAIVWSASFGVTFGAISRKFHKSISFIRRRMKDILNGLLTQRR